MPTAAWFAGLYEGEGCIQVWRAKSDCYILRASVANTELDLLNPILAEFGGHISKSHCGNGQKTCYAWMSDGPTAARFFTGILPYIVCNRRRRSIVLGLHFQALKYDPERFEPRPGVGGRQVKQQFRNEEIAIRNRLKAINGYKRGRQLTPTDKGVTNRTDAYARVGI